MPALLRRHATALRMLLVLMLVGGLDYPMVLLGLAQLPGMRHQAQGSPVELNGQVVGSELIGQSFTDSDGKPLPQYFQSRPSHAGNGYDPTSSGAANLGPTDMVDTLAVNNDPTTAKPSLLSQICTASKAVGDLENVDGSRPYCTPDGVGAVLGVFHADGLTGSVTRVVSLNEACPTTPFLTVYQNVRVECAHSDGDYSAAVVVPVRGTAPAQPVVPADAVTGSASGLDPAISPAYARLQVPRVATQRGVAQEQVLALVEKYTSGRTAGFLGEPAVNVLELNVALDRMNTVPNRKG